MELFMEKEQGNGCILVVDDAELARDLGATFLKKAGYTVVEASDGDDAVRKYVEFNPVLVLLDIIMPNVDGIQALRTIRKIDPQALVLICTATDDYRVIDITMKDGAAGYIIKPYKGSELLKKVKEILENRRGRVSNPAR